MRLPFPACNPISGSRSLTHANREVACATHPARPSGAQPSGLPRPPNHLRWASLLLNWGLQRTLSAGRLHLLQLYTFMLTPCTPSKGSASSSLAARCSDLSAKLSSSTQEKDPLESQLQPPNRTMKNIHTPNLQTVVEAQKKPNLGSRGRALHFHGVCYGDGCNGVRPLAIGALQTCGRGEAIYNFQNNEMAVGPASFPNWRQDKTLHCANGTVLSKKCLSKQTGGYKAANAFAPPPHVSDVVPYISLEQRMPGGTSHPQHSNARWMIAPCAIFMSHMHMVQHTLVRLLGTASNAFHNS